MRLLGWEIRFRHQLLQEYSTACAIQAHIDDILRMRVAELWPVERWWERSGWEESAMLLAGLYADDCTPIVCLLRDAQPKVAAQFSEQRMRALVAKKRSVHFRGKLGIA